MEELESAACIPWLAKRIEEMRVTVEKCIVQDRNKENESEKREP